MLLIPYPFIAIHRYLIFSIGVIFVIGFASLISPIKFNKQDSLWFAFLLYALFSGIWAINISLVWFPLALWISMFLWMKSMIILNLAILKSKISGLFLYLTLFIYLYILSFYVLKYLSIGFILPLGYNSHYHTILLLTLYPFIHFGGKSWITIHVKLLIILSLVALIVITHSKGSMLTFLVILLLFIAFESKVYSKLAVYTSKTFRIKSIIVIVVMLLTIFFILPKIGAYFIDSNDASRLFQLKETLRLLKDSTFLGVGLGNWFMEAYTIDITEHIGLSNPSVFTRLQNHSIYALLLAEVGVIGLFLYCSMLLPIALRGFKIYVFLTSFQKACLYCLVCYLVASLFYLSSFSYEGYFSGIQFLGFVSCGVLSSSLSNSVIRS